MKKIGFVCLFLALFLSSCDWGQTKDFADLFESDNHIPTLTATDLSTVTPAKTSTPSPTSEPSSTITPSATPFGGKPLRVAYLSFRCEEINTKNCIILADFFSGEVMYKIPLNDLTIKTHISWSPDGRYLMYTDRWEIYVNVMLFDVEKQESTTIESYLLRMPTQLVSDTGSVKKYSVFVVDNNVAYNKWSPDGKYVAYTTWFNTEDDSVYVYSLSEKENRKLDGYLSSYYWLDNGENLLELKTGNVYNVRSKEISKIPYAYFMNIDSKNADYLLSEQGDNPYYADKVYIIPYIDTLVQLKEKGTAQLLENGIFLAQANANKNRKPDISILNMFIEGDEVILSGYFTLNDPYKAHTFVKFGSMKELPLQISIEDYSDEIITTISPDHRWYLGVDVVWEKNEVTGHYTVISLLNCYDSETREIIHSYDLHLLAEDPHDVVYYENSNLAFYWEE